jgi:hypothetical protein
LELDHLAFSVGAEAQIAIAVVLESVVVKQRAGPGDDPRKSLVSTFCRC